MSGNEAVVNPGSVSDVRRSKRAMVLKHQSRKGRRVMQRMRAYNYSPVSGSAIEI